jgi:RHS repeat-associated protein
MPIPGTYGEPLDYMHARNYSPSRGRFLSLDSVLGNLLRPQSWNRFAYVMNDPVGFTDPTGRSPSGIRDQNGEPCPDGAVGPCFTYEEESGGFDRWFNDTKAEWEAFRSKARGLGAYAPDSRDISNFIGGFGSGVSFGLTAVIQDEWDEKVWDGVASVDRDSLAYETGQQWGLVIQAAIQFEGLRTGYEFKFGKDLRIAPWGNRTKNPQGELPHYHRRVTRPDGRSVPGGGIGRHRPWQTPVAGRGWWTRF